jgi:hypothetical protein
MVPSTVQRWKHASKTQLLLPREIQIDYIRTSFMQAVVVDLLDILGRTESKVVFSSRNTYKIEYLKALFIVPKKDSL